MKKNHLEEDHCFLTSELTLKAEAQAQRLGNLK